VTNSQLFTFDGKSTTIPLAPTNQAGTCLFNNNGKLDQQACTVASPSAGEVFSEPYSGNIEGSSPFLTALHHRWWRPCSPCSPC
jgi:hypothetical protein